MQEENKPVPEDNELLIRVHAVLVGEEDPMQRKGRPYFGRIFVGLTKPKKPILGTEFCGEVEEVGKDVEQFKKGDRVRGVTGAGFGCYAEFMCMPEGGLVSIKPPNMTDEEAAPICGALAAWNLLKAIANIQSGQKVLIYGACGSTGLAAIQIAKEFGGEVTAVCSSSNLELALSLGAHKVIDYSFEDFTKNGLSYDVILDVSGKSSSLPFKNALNKKGYYLTTYPSLSILLQSLWTPLFRGKKVVFSATGLKPVSERLSFLRELTKLYEEGKLKTVIDQSFPLEQMVEAHRYVERGLEKGSVIVSI